MRTALVLCPLIVLAALAIAALARSEEPAHAARPAAAVKATVAEVPSLATRPTAPLAGPACWVAAEVPSPAERPEAARPANAPARPFYEAMPAFADSPEGAFARLKLGILAKDEAVLREATTVTDEAELKEMLAEQKLLAVEVGSVEIAGDKATLRVTFQGREGIPMGAVRIDGKWKIDPAAFRAETQCRDCMNNLRQLGTYIVMWCSKYGKDTLYPGPGPNLFFDLFTKPSPGAAIARGGEGMLLCHASGERNTPEGIQRGDIDCMSYECTSQKVEDGVTHPEAPIAWDRAPVHGGKRNVLFFAGNVSTMDETKFQALLAKYGR